MRVWKGIRGLLAAVVLLAGSAGWAGDVALILGGERDGPGPGAFAEPLRDAGFRIVEPRNTSATRLREAAHLVETLLTEGEVDRLIVVALGPFAGGEVDSWLLSDDSAGASRLSIGATALSVNALSALAQRAGEHGVVMLARSRPPRDLGPGLRGGLGPYRVAGGVSYVSGRSARMLPLLREGLLNPEVSLAEIAARAPYDVTLSGYLPRDRAFLGPTGGADPRAAREAGYWQAVRDLDTVEGFELYLDRYRNGRHADEARDRIDFLKAEPERRARQAEEALNLSREARRTVQRNLALLGFDPKGIDGVLGPASRAALRAWQRANAFEETGYLTGNQLFRLRDQAKARAEELEEEQRKRRLEQQRLDRAYWRSTGRGTDEAGLRAYLERYPDGLFSDLARTRLDEIEEDRRGDAAREVREAWDRARAGDTIDHYRAFLDRHPDSVFSEAARARLRELRDARENSEAVRRARREERQFAGSRVGRLLIEQRLAQLGVDPGNVDGEFTERTRRAIRRFQREGNLPVTGYVSRGTMVRLMAGR